MALGAPDKSEPRMAAVGTRASAPGDRFLTVAQLAETIGYSVSHTWLRARTECDFPQPVKAGKNATRWLESEVQAWIASRPRVERTQRPEAA